MFIWADSLDVLKLLCAITMTSWKKCDGFVSMDTSEMEDERCDSDGEVIATTRWRETVRLRKLKAHFEGKGSSGSGVLYGGYERESRGKGSGAANLDNIKGGQKGGDNIKGGGQKGGGWGGGLWAAVLRPVGPRAMSHELLRIDHE